ncbi:hypothetical protein ACFY8X_39150 [Streptomyces tanashiensis]|uniref:hypothetical protein n=1 Tax=Streptomyces tanashiensis TaxID=67367 RepID=UPI0036E96227
MSNISHAHGQFPTNDPILWGALVIFLAVCFTSAENAAHISAAMQVASTFASFAVLLTRRT